MYFVQRRTAVAINQMLNQKSLTLVGTVVAVLIGGVGVSLALSSPTAKTNEDPISVTTTVLEPEVTIENLPIVTEPDPGTDSLPSASTTTTSVSQPASGISGNIGDDDDDEYEDEDEDEDEGDDEMEDDDDDDD
jgi:hypothetical protein